MFSKDILSRLRVHSEEPKFLDEGEDSGSVVGRTGADLLYDSRFYILIVVAILIGAFALILLPGAREAISDNLDILKLFFIPMIIFYWIGMRILPVLLHVPTMDFLVLDFENFTAAIYRIPLPLLTQMKITGGNNLNFSWRTGESMKLARRVDLDNGVIETAWPHEVPIEQAAFTMSDLQRREKDYERKSIENLLLRRRPTVIGADLARDSNMFLSKELSELLKLKQFDIDEYLRGLDPLEEPVRKDPMEDGDDGE